MDYLKGIKMGGLHEDKIEVSKLQVIDEPEKRSFNPDDLIQGTPPVHDRHGKGFGNLPFIPAQTQSIRHHLSGKDVHFHIDDEKLKVAIPIAQLESYFYDLKSLNRIEHFYYDDKNATLTHFRAGINSNNQIDVWITVSKCEEGPVVQKLEKLISSSRKKK